MSKLVKKIVLYGALLMAIFYGYRYITGKSITTLPGDLAGKLNQKGPAESTNPRYHQDPAKQYKGMND